MYFCQGTERHAWADPEDAARCCNGFERAVRVVRDARGHVELTYYWRPTPESERPVNAVAAGPGTAAGIAGGVTPPGVLTVVQGSGGERRERETSDGWLDSPTSSAPDTLRHVAFFQALGELESASLQWESTSAGLIVLRLVDRWVWRHVRERTPTFREFVVVRRALARLPAGEVRHALEQLAAAVSAFSAERTAPVNECLVHYAQVLQDSAQWAMAADVYDTVIVNARSAADANAIPACAVRAGFCLRMLGKLDEADRGYRFALDVAVEMGDRPSALLARVGLASVAAQRGRLSDAASVLDAVIAEAAAADLVQVRASALHDRGGVAVLSGEYDTGVVQLYEAFSLYRDVANRDRALNDVATALASLGLHQAAHDAYFVIQRTSEQRDLRWWAGLNLMRLAVIQQNEREFDQYRRHLSEEGLTGTHAAHYELFVGEGWMRFGQPERARMSFDLAIQLAHRFRLPSVVAGAEAHRLTAESGRGAGSGMRAASGDAMATAAIARVVNAIRALAGAES